MQAVAVLGLLAYNIKHGVNQFRTLGVMALGPIIAGTRLTEDKVIGPEDLTKGAGSNGVHGSGLEVHEDSSWDVPPAAGFIVVNVDALELKLRIAAVLAGMVDAMLVADDLPEFGADLIAALASLNMKDFSHISLWVW